MFVVFLTIYIVSNIYIVYKIASDLSLKGLSLAIFILVYSLFSAISLYSFILLRNVEPTLLTKSIKEFGYIWLGVYSIAFTCLVVSNIALIFNHSQQFKYVVSLISISVIIIISIYSLINAYRNPQITNITIKIPNLPTDKLTIVELADIHIDLQTKFETIQNIVKITNSLNPDVIAFVGDLSDTNILNTYKNYGLDNLQSKYGVFAVSGNHEYYIGIKNYELLCKKLNFILLDNKNVLIDNMFYIAGITDLKASKQLNYNVADITKSLENIDFIKPVIFLSHQPNAFYESSKFPITLQLSGHTHAGQVPPFDIIEYFIYKYFTGLYRENNSYIYVTSGARHWGPPMRLFSKSEIVCITLIKE